MADTDFTKELCAFIQDNLSTVEAAELLLFLSRHPERIWKLEEIVNEIRPTVITDSEAKKYLGLFNAVGLLSKTQDDYLQYKPASPELEAVVKALTKAYNERPVTLIRMIYALREAKIQSFADAFKIKKD